MNLRKLDYSKKIKQNKHVLDTLQDLAPFIHLKAFRLNIKNNKFVIYLD